MSSVEKKSREFSMPIPCCSSSIDHALGRTNKMQRSRLYHVRTHASEMK